MQLIPYLNFGGNCRAAFEFYRDALAGEIIASMTYGESPMRDELPAESHGWIMHTQLQADAAVLMGADGPPPHAQGAAGTCVNISVDEPEEAERIFQALSEGGEVRMPLQQTFWARRFGMLVDRFGKPWMVNCTVAACGQGEEGARDAA